MYVYFGSNDFKSVNTQRLQTINIKQNRLLLLLLLGIVHATFHWRLADTCYSN